jgi:hypothetical protein
MSTVVLPIRGFDRGFVSAIAEQARSLDIVLSCSVTAKAPSTTDGLMLASQIDATGRPCSARVCPACANGRNGAPVEGRGLPPPCNTCKMSAGDNFRVAPGCDDAHPVDTLHLTICTKGQMSHAQIYDSVMSVSLRKLKAEVERSLHNMRLLDA